MEGNLRASRAQKKSGLTVGDVSAVVVVNFCGKV